MPTLLRIILSSGDALAEVGSSAMPFPTPGGALSLVMAALLVVGCATASDRPADVADSVSTSQTEIASACRELAQTSRTTILCPTWLPTTVDVQRSIPQACSYFIEALAKGYTGQEALPFHFIVAGRCRPFSLAVRPDGRWPVRPNKRDYLSLVGERSLRPGASSAPLELPLVIGQETVDGKPALLCRIAPYPNGGLHGGHYALIWNDGGDGYVVSMHYGRGDSARAPTSQNIRDLRRAARSMADVRP
jgi:hypothetical protein